MKKYEKEILQAELDQEKKVLKKLEKNYQDALDEINSKIEILLARQDADMQHVIYQVEYQKALKTQVQTILDTLHTNEFETVSEYLTKSYDEGFLSTMYTLQRQNIPLVFPIDQAQVVAAIQEETKLSEPLYTAMGKDITELRRKIAGEISRGISTGMMSAEISRNIASWANIPKNNAMRIARTESHRIQNKAISDAQHKAKKKGADVVKIWSAALDGRTRDNHRRLDGQIRELEDAFEMGGLKAMFPGDFGDPKEDCNCRCRCNSKARWLLGEDFTKWTGNDEIVQIKARDYEEFKEIYTGLAAKIGGNGIPAHEEPKLLKKIKFNDKKAVMKEIASFESNAVKETIETACVITKDGEVYQCFGIEDRVFPDSDLKEKLYGGIISHNHPIVETAFSFSDADLQLFLQFDLEMLRGCDEKYTYEFTRDASKIDEALGDWMDEENYWHFRMIASAKNAGVGYRRWKNE